MFAWLKNIVIQQFRHNRSDFASVASHELRTPLSIVKWYTEILLDEDMGPLNEDQKKYLRVIESSNERAIALVTSLLNVSRLELDTFSVSPEPLLFTQVVEEVLKKQQRKIEEKHLILSKDISGDSFTIPLDKGITILIVRSIIENAVAYSKDGGKIKLSVLTTPALITYTVSDDGIGIPLKEQDKVFEKMFRGSNVPDEEKGSGLSLYIVKTLLSKIGGTIIFSSDKEKTVFTVTIPTTGMSFKKGVTKLEPGLA